MSFRFERGFTLQEALDIISAEDIDNGRDVTALYIAPPESSVLTDEDSGDEDEGGLVDNLSGKQLLADAEIRYTQDEEEMVDDMDVTSNVQPDVSVNVSIDSSLGTQLNIPDVQVQPDVSVNVSIDSSLGTQLNIPDVQVQPDVSVNVSIDSSLGTPLNIPDVQVQPDVQADRSEEYQTKKSNLLKELKEEYIEESKLKKKKIPIKKSWVQGDMEVCNVPFPVADFSKYQDLTACELFELFVDDNLIKQIEQDTLSYALFKNFPNPNITKDNIKCFLAILIFSGYNVLPGKRYYWDSQPDMHQGFIVNSMRRNKFDTIMRFIHFADNNHPDLQDKMWKLRPLIEQIKPKFMKHFIPLQNLCYDESMIEYYGRHSCKQSIRMKPIRFGYKVWCVNTPNGYLVNFDVYQGKSKAIPTDYQLVCGKSAAPLLHLIDGFPVEKSELPYRFHFDNLFTSLRLLKYLFGMGYSGIGTIRDNRLPTSCPVMKKKDMKDTERGYYEHALCKEDGILVCTWHDNGVVSIATNSYGIHPVTKVKRYSQAQKKHILVDRPAAFGKYNESMGGTDRMDQNIANYRISMRSKKWYWPIFTWLIDTCIHNAWQLRRSTGSLQPQLDFRRELVTTYITRYGESRKGPGRPLTSKRSLSDSRVCDELRYDGMNHLVISTADKKRKRCAGEGCISVVRTMCKKCNVGLCIECFSIFHSTTY